MLRGDFAVGLWPVLVPSEKVEAIREATDIVAWIGRCVSLKKNGRDLVGLCPFHAEKSPSFAVSPHKNMYYCFGCHVGGDIFDFVMRYDNLDFTGAAHKLAEAAGVALSPENPEAVRRRQLEQAVAALNAAAQTFFTAQLWGASGATARQYLTKRQIPAAFARAQQLGFGGDAEAFNRHMQAALTSQNLPTSVLTDTGLVGQEQSWPLFVGRLIFPIRDLEGRVAGFGGRRLTDDTGTPKYLNSREGILFNKRHLLFGLHQAQAAVRRSRRLVFVEGYMDVLAAKRAGIAETVAAMGTALTAEHAAICRRLANVAYLLLDADAAGLRAAYTASRTLLAAPIEVHVVALPKGEDPDSLLRHRGPEALRAAMTQAVPAVEFFMQRAFAGPDLTIEARASGARQLMPLLLALPSGLERELYISRLADKVGVSVAQLKKATQVPSKERLARSARGHAQRSSPSSTPPHNGVQAGNPQTGATGRPGHGLALQEGAQAATSQRMHRQRARELELLRELLLFPSLRDRLGELADYMLIQENAALLEALATSQQPVATVLMDHLSDPHWRARLEQVGPVQGLNETDVNVQANRTFDDILARLKWCHVDAFLAEVLREIAAAEAMGQATEALMRRKQELTARKRSLRRATKIERVRA